MPRAKRAGDLAWNARRRYARQAERYTKQAQQATGMEEGRLETLARASLERAISTYQDPAKAGKSKLIQDLTEQLKPKVPTRKTSESRLNKLVDESEDIALESSLSDDEIRRELEAEAILSTEVGSRVYGALVDIWRDADYADRNQAITDYFGVDSMADVLDMIEAEGIDIYAEPDSLDKYEETRTAISEHFA